MCDGSQALCHFYVLTLLKVFSIFSAPSTNISCISYCLLSPKFKLVPLEKWENYINIYIYHIRPSFVQALYNFRT